ncbi:MAG: imm11 family protein [Candidatus Limnocylindria bacterium]
MTSFFYLSWLDDASVCVAEGSDDPERDRLLSGRDPVQVWSAPRLVVESDELVDYLPNNLGVRLCSRRMRDLIDANLGPRDSVQWLPAEVIDIFGAGHDYFVLHMPGDDDVLNESHSIFSGDFVVKPVIEAEKVRGRQMFRLPEAMLTALVTRELQAKLADAAMTGVHFEAAPTA